MKAKELIKAGISGVVIFTRGANFRIDSRGTGTTGYWVVSPNRQVDDVIIYHRRESKDANDVYIAKYDGIVPSPEKGRYIIKLKGIRFVDSTSVNWHKFAEGGANPIRYIEKNS